jgi:multidrug efflux pump subunit AcrB
MNNSPNVIEAINSFPIKWVDGREVFMRDVAHVHDGFQVQTNSVSVDGVPGALMTIRSTGGVSTLAVINGIRAILPEIRHMLPHDVRINPIFDQSVFVKAALNSVLMGGALAAALTALMILLFLGNWRLTVMILAAIPLSIITAVLVMGAGGETLNTMTLGGFALAVGILVDNGTVVIENIERNVALRPHLGDAIVYGCGEVGMPTFLSTLCICIVFVPVFLLQGTAKYLFSPLSVSVIVALLASLVLSFTMVPVLFFYLMRAHARLAPGHAPTAGAQAPPAHGAAAEVHPLLRVHLAFEGGFRRFREAYREAVAWALSQPRLVVLAFTAIMLVSLPLFPFLGRDFFPDVDAGQMRLHVRAPPGTRLETTQQYFAQVEASIRQLVGNEQISVILDNLGLPYSGINIALSDSATVGPMDGEILISLQKRHTATAQLTARLRRELPLRYPALQFFFQPADIVDQVLNFGEPAPIDVRVSAADTDSAYKLAARLSRLIARIPGVDASRAYPASSTRTCSRCRTRRRSRSTSTVRSPHRWDCRSARPPATCS